MLAQSARLLFEVTIVGLSLGAAGDELRERGAEARLGREVAELVEHEHVAGEQGPEHSLPTEGGRRSEEAPREVLGGDKPSRVAELDEHGRDADGEHRLAQPWWAQPG